MIIRNLFISMVILVLSGCCSYMPNDLMFEVKGVAPPETECELNLLIDGKPVLPSEPITGDFHAIFYVSFCKSQYTLQAVCRGKIVFEKAVIFPDKMTNQPYDVGMLNGETMKTNDNKP